MRNIVVYRQSLTIATVRWNIPHRKDGEKWVPIEYKNSLSLRNKRDGSLRGAIIKMKKLMEKMGHSNNHPIWNCTMSSKKVGGYRIYYLICKRIPYAPPKL
jgi:hypothetical protein